MFFYTFKKNEAFEQSRMAFSTLLQSSIAKQRQKKLLMSKNILLFGVKLLAILTDKKVLFTTSMLI